MTRTGSFVGTPHFASPEQAVGDELDGRSDLYAFGVLLYRMVVGRLPFDAPGKPLRVLRMQMTERPPVPSSIAERPIPEWFDNLLMQLLEKFPEDRPEAAGLVAAAIAAHSGTADTLEIDDAARRLVTQPPTADLVPKASEPEISQQTVLVAAVVAALIAAAAGVIVGMMAG